MDRAALRQLVIDHTGRTDKTTVINKGLDLALTECGKLHDFRSMISEDDTVTIAEDDSSADLSGLPGTVWHVKNVVVLDDTSSYEMQIRTRKWIQERWPYIESTFSNRPEFCYLDGHSTLRFVPPSNAAYTLRITYSQLPPALATDATENPLISADYAIACWATAHCYRSLEMFDQAREWTREFARAVVDAQRADGRNEAKKQALGFRPTEVVFSGMNPWEDPFSRKSH